MIAAESLFSTTYRIVKEIMITENITVLFLLSSATGSGSLGTGPGVIHIDHFAKGYQANRARNQINSGEFTYS